MPTVGLPASVTLTGAYAPAGKAAFADEPDYYRDGCRIGEDSPAPAAGSCRYGVPGGTTVAILGDSKMGQWMPALQRIAEVESWSLHFYSRSGCPYAVSGVTPVCADFVRLVGERLRTTEQPRLVFVSHVAHASDIADSESALLTELSAATGTRAGVVEHNPQPGKGAVPDGRAGTAEYWIDCNVRKNNGSGTGALRAVAQRVPAAVLLTLNDAICPTTQRCPPVVDRIAVFRAGSHLTKTFVNHLAPLLHERLIDAGVAAGPVLVPT